MSNTKNLANLAAALDDGTSGQVLQSTGSGGVQFTDSSGSGVTVHANQAAMLTDAASANEGTLHYETGTNKLYVKQTSGFYLLASITNVAPTIDSFSENTGGAGANDLTNATPPNTFTLTAGSNTVITINATEPDLETISYSATVTSGTATDVFSSPSFPVTNQSSNVFTLTPVTSGSGGTVTIRFDASDGTNVANVSHSFEIAFVIADSHYTTLLMATDGSAGDNNDITDSSTNNHTITVAGDAHAGTFSPYRHGGYSTYFGGSGNHLTLSSSSEFAYGTGDFTWEAWIYVPSSIENHYVLDHGSNGGSITIANTTLRYYNSTTGTSSDLYTGTTIELNTWHHVAVVRSSGTTTLYLDGITKQSANDFHSYAAQAVSIGRYGGGTQYNFTGYITDLRIVKGTAITPASGGPTERLTAITNTSLLTCHLPYIADGSSNGHSITVGGNISTEPIGPYDYDEYSESINGGSVYFDGTGDYLSIADHAGLDMGSSDFTIEGWYYPKTTANTMNGLFSKRANSTEANGILIYFAAAASAGTPDLLVAQSGSWSINSRSSIPFVTGVWNHFAIVRNGTSFKLYINGQTGISVTSSITVTDNNSAFVIGAMGADGSNSIAACNIADFRIVKGTAVYSGNFTPPSGPLTTTGGTYPSTTNVDTSITASNTSLLLSGTDAHVLDKSQVSNLKLVGDAASTSALTSGSTPPYIGAAWAGTSAVYFDGTGDRALTTGAPDLGDDFTIEAWIYSTATGNAGIVGSLDNYGSFGGSGYWGFMRNASNKLILYIDNGTYTQSTSTVPLNQWVHVACTRSSGTIYYYIDGTRDSTTVSNSLFLKNPSGLVIGSSPNNNYVYNFNGYIQDLRLTVGNVRYTAADETSNIPSAPLKG